MTRRRSERGSAAIEAAIGVPAFALFIGLIIYGGRTATTHQALEAAAAEGARSASISRDAGIASSAARDSALTSMARQGIRCHDVNVGVDTSDFAKAPGQPGTVQVRLSCRLALSDLTVPGIPGSRVLSSSMSSPIDTWRER